MNLANKLQKIEPQIHAPPWAGYEHYRGYGVMVLPFSSGHLLGLRVFPENDFAPYKSVWHRTPAGDWSIYNDGPSLKTTCPRWWGPALRHADLTPIELTWTGPNELRVEMTAPQLVWTLSMTAPLLLQVLNAVSAALPLWTWKPAPLIQVREWMAKWLLAMGELRFSFTTPSGQEAIIMPQKIFFIETAQAVWQGSNLGEPVRLESNPTIGGIPLPTRPVLVIGQAYARILDPEEYRRTREGVRTGTSDWANAMKSLKDRSVSITNSSG